MSRRIIVLGLAAAIALFGAAAAMLWTRGGGGEPPKPWVDASPHRQQLVAGDGVRLECLDWGGQGEPIVFLAGLGLTAHVFDELAPQFTDTHHVLGLTRRGFGASEKPPGGYDLATLALDLRHAFDALGIERATVVGHSYGAQEAAAFATAYPERVSKVVYLDGAYGFTAENVALNQRLAALWPQPSAEASMSARSLVGWHRRNTPGWNDARETDFWETQAVGHDGSISGERLTPNSVFEALMDAAMKSGLDFSKVRAPALAIFADHRLDTVLAGLDTDARAKAAPLVEQMFRRQADEIASFRTRVPNAVVVELADADHMCFTHREDDVVRHMRAFLGDDSP